MSPNTTRKKLKKAGKPESQINLRIGQKTGIKLEGSPDKRLK